MKNIIRGILVWFVLVAVVGAEETRDFEGVLREFGRNRYQLAQSISEQLDVPLPDSVHRFFHAAISNDWASVSNRFRFVMKPGKYASPLPVIRNELWATIHETFGIWEVWDGWQKDSALLEKFYRPIMASMPEGSIYFDGTDYGRFVITSVNAVEQPPKVITMTQNALADNTYMAHLRFLYRNQCHILDTAESNRAFQEYVNRVQNGDVPKGATIDTKNGRVTVTGVTGVMMINGALCEIIFERNKDQHPFFVEESYVIDWMYPYLEPHGLIMKLNPEKLDSISEAAVIRDMEFWQKTEDDLMSHPGWEEHESGKMAFAKLRSAIAGIYAYRNMNPEAEAAFQQALRICPASPEPLHRLVALYESQSRISDAIHVLENQLTINDIESPEKAREKLAELKQRLEATDGDKFDH
jgi:tetratricopeptide (TPR) repeat protein